MTSVGISLCFQQHIQRKTHPAVVIVNMCYLLARRHCSGASLMPYYVTEQPSLEALVSRDEW